MKAIVLLLFICFEVSGMSPTFPYSFNAPEFERLLPFTPKELAILKHKKIKKVSKNDGSYYTDYYLNNNGMIVRELNYYLKNKKKCVIDSVSYEYNNNEFLILKKSMGHINSYDSIVYSKDNRVIRYLSYQIDNKGRKDQTKDIYWDLHLDKQTDEEVILVDDHDSLLVQHITFDKNNKILKKVNNFSTDSIAIIGEDHMNYSLNYYYKDRDNQNYKLGQRYDYKNGLLNIFTNYDKLGDGTFVTIRTHYTYDNNSNLIQTINDNLYQSKYLFTHNDSGLILEIIRVDRDIIVATRFNYEY